MNDISKILNELENRGQLSGFYKIERGEGPPGVARFHVEAYLDRFFSSILAEMGELAGLAKPDLDDAWRQNLVYLENDFETFFSRYAESLSHLMGQRWRSEPLPLNFSTVSYPFMLKKPFAPQLVWQSSDKSFEIYLVGQFLAGKKLHTEEKDYPWGRLFVTIVGSGSSYFFKKFCHDATSSLATLLDCAARLASLQAGVKDEASLEQYLRDFELSDISDSSGEGVDRSPTMLFVGDCIDALYTDVTTKRDKDSIQRRIKNAVRLLIEAKKQSDNAIGLALSVSAIEALVCRKGENVTQMFAENMAVVLEPQLQYRAEAERWCKGLYDRRSAVLHGSSLESAIDDLLNAECAATAVLKAMLDRRRAQRRMAGEDENPEELLREFKESKYTAGQPMFVPKTPVNRLWRKPAK